MEFESLPWESINLRNFPPSTVLSLSQTNSLLRSKVIPTITRDYTFRIPKCGKITSFTVGKAILAHPNSISPSLTQIQFTNGVNQYLDLLLPPALTHLSLGICFTRPLDHLPPQLTHLTFSEASLFNLPLDYLPARLTHLEVGRHFNRSVDYLPASLKSFKFGDSFNQSLDNLPPLLETIKCSTRWHDFNQPVDNLPQSLIELELGDKFNHSLDNLPPLLTTLVVANPSYNRGVDHLPASLTHLTIAAQHVDHLPAGLVHLEFKNEYSIAVDHLPPNLKYLCGDFDEVDNLPNSVEKLICTLNGASVDNLPTSLLDLELYIGMDTTIKYLPTSLQSLFLACEEDVTPLSHLPESLLYIESVFPSDPIALPPNLQTLNIHLDSKYAERIPLPKTITTLQLFMSRNTNSRQEMNQYLVSDLPPGLLELSIRDTSFATPLTPLPVTLTTLSIGSSYPRQLDLRSCSALTSLTIHDDSSWYCPPLELLPPSLTTLNAANLHSDMTLPNSVKHVFLTTWLFNLPALNSLVTVLSLGEMFNSSLENLPLSLRELTLGYAFNQPVNNLPHSLVHLWFGNMFDQPIDFLPQKLRTLRLGNSFSHSLGRLPYSLETLTLAPLYSIPHGFVFPPYLEIINLKTMPVSMPKWLKTDETICPEICHRIRPTHNQRRPL